MILGLNAYHGDVSAVLLRDGELVAAVEEERFRRVKHWAGFPREAIRACLEMEGLTPQEPSEERQCPRRQTEELSRLCSPDTDALRLNDQQVAP